MAGKNGFFGKLFKKTTNNIDVKDKEVTSSSEVILYSPMKGKVVPLSEVKDEVFSEGIMGKGIAVEPSEGKVYSPVTGVIVTVLPTKHAIGIIGENNVELLIHIGMDTVNLNGKYYIAHVKANDKVKAGDLILEFDMDKIKSAGYEVVTPVIVTNSDNFNEMVMTDAEDVSVGDKLMTVMK